MEYKKKLLEACRDGICPAKGLWDEDGYLYNGDIDNVLGPHSDGKIFKFIGVNEENCYLSEKSVLKLDMDVFKDSLKALPKYIGMVFQIYGIHWIGILIEYDKANNRIIIEYFDSLALKFTADIEYILFRLCLFLSLKYFGGKKGHIKLVYSLKELQKKDGDCGVWVIDFILSRIWGVKSLKEYVKKTKNKSSDYISGKRKVLFRKD